jgi:hypothetical protein
MLNSASILQQIPAGLRESLLNSYQEMVSNFSEHRWEPAELNGGKFCEVVHSILNGYLQGVYPVGPSKPRNIVDACRALEQIPQDPNRVGDHSARKLIPKVLLPLYEIRNNRGVGHVGGDVNPNLLDATVACGMASWILAELIRMFHNIPIKEAQEIVDALIERKLPLIWEVDGIRRILDPSMKIADQVLVLLHARPSWTSEKDIFTSVEYSTLNNLRKKVFEPLHEGRKVEYDSKQGRIRISPVGSKEVETKILATR